MFTKIYSNSEILLGIHKNLKDIIGKRTCMKFILQNFRKKDNLLSTFSGSQDRYYILPGLPISIKLVRWINVNP